MRKITKQVRNNILRKTPWGHSSSPRDEGLNTEQIKGMFYKAITDEENSVIAEINRVVEEGNKQFAEIDNTEYFGKLESDELFAEKQSWVRNGNLVYVYGKLNSLSSITDNNLESITNIGLGKSLVLRLTAPEGVIPDNSLTLTIGETAFKGLSLLKNSQEEAMNGIYYLRFAIRVNNIRKQTVSIKWNEDSNEETVVFDFNDDYAESIEKKLFIKFASSEDGKNASEEWSEGKEYVGFYSGVADADASAYKWAKFASSKSTLALSYSSFHSYIINFSSWSSTNTATLSFDALTETSFVIAIPEYRSHDNFYKYKIHVKERNGRFVVFECDEVPPMTVDVHFFIINPVS